MELVTLTGLALSAMLSATSPPARLADSTDTATARSTMPEVLVAEAPIAAVGTEAYGFLPITIHGHALTVMLDVGTRGVGIVLSPQVLDQIGFPTTLTLDSLTIGTVVEHTVSLQIEHFPLAAPPGMAPMAGILGSTVLSHYDLVFNGPAHRVRLYAPSVDPVRHRVPWLPAGLTSADCVPLRADPDGTNGVFLDVQVNNHPLPSMFDSGSGTTNINVAAARLLGITKHTSGVRLLPPGTVAQFPSLGEQKVWEVTGVALTVGSQRLTGRTIYVYQRLPRELGPDDPELSLGLNTINDRILVVSYSTKRVCLSGAPAAPAHP